MKSKIFSIYESSVIFNSTVFSNSSIKESTVDDGGFFAYIENSNLKIYNSTFSNISTNYENGGVMYIYSSLDAFRF
jgi:hypothetical protein